MWETNPMLQVTHWNTSDQLKFTLAKWAKICDCRPVVNTCKAKPKIIRWAHTIKFKFVFGPWNKIHRHQNSSWIFKKNPSNQRVLHTNSTISSFWVDYLRKKIRGNFRDKNNCYEDIHNCMNIVTRCLTALQAP